MHFTFKLKLLTVFCNGFIVPFLTDLGFVDSTVAVWGKFEWAGTV